MTVQTLLNTIVPKELSQTLAQGTVVTIGNFDGVHRGHQTIVQTVSTSGRKIGAKSVALTFEPHPTTFFQHRAPESFRLTSSETRERLLRMYGIDEVVTIDFEHEFANLSPNDFVFELLVARLHAKEIHIGYDFAFGRGREGTTSKLQELAAQAGVEVVIHSAYEEGHKAISSTLTRAALLEHDLDKVHALLGRPYSIVGYQASGAQRGRAMGIPTINLYPTMLLMPPHGVYISRVVAEGKSWPAITNIGVRPTFEDDDRLSVETFILDEQFTDIRAGERIEVELYRWVREERRFESQDALRAQIGKDVAQANLFHASFTPEA